MGQGYSHTGLSVGIDIPELSILVYKRSLSSSRFMNSICAGHNDALVVVKVFTKPCVRMGLEPYIEKLSWQQHLLQDIPNALTYERILETSSAGYLVRQYMHSSLYDRISTRPFLEIIEKKWITFQLLCALRDCHSRDVYHGDIKMENILVTSWNWIYLSDFSTAFKPTFLPEDNPADFTFYFDTSGRRTCYLAPERFIAPGERAENRSVDWAMDIFSAGCVIAELFLESPVFTLSQLYNYRRMEYDPEGGVLDRVDDPDVRELVLHMIRLNPEARYSAEECLTFWCRKVFPEYFYSFLHQYMGVITGLTFARRISNVEGYQLPLQEADVRIRRVCDDLGKILYFLQASQEAYFGEAKFTLPSRTSGLLSLQFEIPSPVQSLRVQSSTVADGSLMILSLVTSNLRSCARGSTRVRACDILLAFSKGLPDETTLDRIVPYITLLFSDRADMVKIAALYSLCDLLLSIQLVSPINSYAFSGYIISSLKLLAANTSNHPNPTVRAAYASCIASLAESCLHILDVVEALSSDVEFHSLHFVTTGGMLNSNILYSHFYDSACSELLQFFETRARLLLTDPDNHVRRAFLVSVSGLCTLLGNSMVNEVILPHMNTFINCKDRVLRCTFLDVAIGIGAYVGSSSLEEFILPLLVHSLSDREDTVVERALRSISRIANFGLLQLPIAADLLCSAVAFFVHPNGWIREAAIHLVTTITSYMSRPVQFCLVSPLVRPFLRSGVVEFTIDQILEALKEPMAKAVWDVVMFCPLTSHRSSSWVSSDCNGGFSFASPSIGSHVKASLGHVSEMPPAALMKEGGEQFVSSLRVAGLTLEEEPKGLIHHGPFRKVSVRRSPINGSPTENTFSKPVRLSQHQITPRSVFLNLPQPVLRPRPLRCTREDDVSHLVTHNIADALLDASTSMHAGLAINKAVTTPHGSSRVEDHRLQKDISPLAKCDVTPRYNHSETSVPSYEREDGFSKILQSAAIGKLNATDTLPQKDDSDSRATERTSANSNIACGEFDNLKRPRKLSQHAPSSSPREPEMTGEKQLSTHGVRHTYRHTYKGKDPTVLKAVDAVINGGRCLADKFEARLSSNTTASGGPLKRVKGQVPSRTWRPDGSLVALFGEHTGPVNRVVVAPDHAFFVTGSDDGTVKVWDANRLENNITPRSRQTHRHAQHAKVRSLTFVEHSHVFISAATDGSVHAVQVDCQRSDNSVRYGKLRLLRNYSIAMQSSVYPNEHAVWMQHFNSGGSSVLLIATNRCRVISLNFMSMDVLYVLENPVNHGIITTFCLDRERHWVLLGTRDGILDLWDLRFRVMLKSWVVSDGGPIHRLHNHPIRGRDRWVCVAGGSTRENEVMVWDIDQLQCREVYRLQNKARSNWPPDFSGENVVCIPKGYQPWKVDDSDFGGLLSLFSDKRGCHTTLMCEHPYASLLKTRAGSSSVRAMSVGCGFLCTDCQDCFILCGGSDCKLRLWDVLRPTSPVHVNERAATPSEGKIFTKNAGHDPAKHLAYTNAQRCAYVISEDCRGAGQCSQGIPIGKLRQRHSRVHSDSILDIAILQNTYTMSISVDRGGMVSVTR